MQETTTSCVQHCPDCGQPLQTLWDYPNNEGWCLRCGNRFYRVLSPGEGEDPLAGFRLLILDDDFQRRELLTGRFATIGYQVTPVCHPRQALEAASFRHFDLAMLSAEWSGYDTPSLITKLRWQLGNVKFVVYVDSERGMIPTELLSPDVLCLRTNLADTHELETALEYLIDDLVGGRSRRSDSRGRLELADAAK
jgi:CheY-like chemotaxis protein